MRQSQIMPDSGRFRTWQIEAVRRRHHGCYVLKSNNDIRTKHSLKPMKIAKTILPTIGLEVPASGAEVARNPKPSKSERPAAVVSGNWLL